MNSTDTNVGGWGASMLRGILNSTTYTGLENKNYIKEVNKDYIATSNDASSVTTSQDKLWLLSCSEIYNNGVNGNPYGSSHANINPNASNEIFSIIKNNNNSDINWWLRSPLNTKVVPYYSLIGLTGAFDADDPSATWGVAPGFSI